MGRNVSWMGLCGLLILFSLGACGSSSTAPGAGGASGASVNGSAFSQWVFEGGAFDGHYVYFVPSQGGPLVRFDTQGDFGSTDAWGTVQLFQVAPGADGFGGAAFDGRYLYLVPNNLLSAVRFDAGASAALPAASHGSFY
jgi:hypothetical protein